MISQVLAVIVIGALPGEAPSYRLTEWIAATDCKIRRVGAEDLELCDLAPALARVALDYRERVPAGWLGYGTRSGPAIQLAAGRWWLDVAVRFCRQIALTGAGGGDWGAGSVIYAPKGGSGLRVAAYDECDAEGLGGGGQGSIIERLALVEATGASVTSSLSWAISLEARAEIRDVFINGFVQGVRISADHNRAPPTNANGWRLWNVVAQNQEHAGLFVDGGDANAGTAVAPNFTGACRRGSYWVPRLGESCADFVMSDFLGGTLIGARASGSFDVETGANFPNYVFEGGSQKAVCLGCYSETDAVPPVLAQHTIWIGASALAGEGGYRQAGQIASGLQLSNDRDPANKVAVYLGSASTVGGAAIELVPSGGVLSYPLRLKAEPATKSWRVDVANLNSGVALRIGGAIDAQGSYGGVTFPKPVYLGSPAIPVQVVSSTTALAQPCVVGTESILRIPQAGKAARAVCVVGGTWEARP